VRAARPDIAISGDYIVGFPGETDADFEATLEIVRRIGHSMAFSFKYSPRPGTPAATMPDQVAPQVMDERLQRLQALIVEQQLAFNHRTVGKRTTALLERPGRRPGQLIGKSPWLQSIVVDEGAVGDLLDVDIVAAGPNSLTGVLTRKQAA
jgi:tRNA-2-methylthio-N6-dimethylallyladenosine synthase